MKHINTTANTLKVSTDLKPIPHGNSDNEQDGLLLAHPTPRQGSRTLPVILIICKSHGSSGSGKEVAEILGDRALRVVLILRQDSFLRLWSRRFFLRQDKLKKEGCRG